LKAIFKKWIEGIVFISYSNPINKYHQDVIQGNRIWFLFTI
jgi:hypothetical protein